MPLIGAAWQLGKHRLVDRADGSFQSIVTAFFYAALGACRSRTAWRDASAKLAAAGLKLCFGPDTDNPEGHP